jgi:mono/diheme cytochrome c family protein
MQRDQLRSGASIPEFIGNEIGDIQAYIRARGVRPEGERSRLLPLPDPLRGEQTYRAKGCAGCHASGRGRAPELDQAALRMTVAQIAGVLWNHSYAMNDVMQRDGTAFPVFREGELADVISFLYFVGYRGRPGDPARGAELFAAKGCAVCHEPAAGRGPDLADLHAGDDAIGLSAAMWNHVPEMHEVMAEYGVPWPKFEEGEMEHVVAFLKSAKKRRGGEQ